MAGAGGDLQPLAFMGDDAVAPAVAPLGCRVHVYRQSSAWGGFSESYSGGSAG